MRLALYQFTSDLRRTLRDPQVATFLLFPVLLYPLLLWGALGASEVLAGLEDAASTTVTVVGPIPHDGLFDDHQLVRAEDADSADVVVETTVDGENWSVEIAADATTPAGYRGLQRVQAAMVPVRKERLLALQAEHGVQPDEWVWESEAHDEGQGAIRKMMGVSMGMLVPLLMLLSGIYPSIDLVTSERERGTLETLLTTSAPRFPLFLGKTMTVATLMVGAAIGNVISLGIVIAQVVVTMQTEEMLPGAPGPLNVVAASMSLVSTAVLAATLTMLLVSLAGSFKEAEWYGSLLTYVGMPLTMMAMFRLIRDEPAGWLSAVPFASCTVHISSLFQPVAPDFLPVLLATTINIVLAALAAGVTVRIVGTEDYVVGGQSWLPWRQPRD